MVKATLVVLCAILSLGTACGPPLVGVDSALSTSDRDELQRAMPRPVIERASVYETIVAETDVPVSFVAFSAWFEKDGKRSLSAFSAGTKTVPPIERTEDLTGAWSRPGDRRRVVYADGTAAVQEIVDSRAHVLEYVESSASTTRWR